MTIPQFKASFPSKRFGITRRISMKRAKSILCASLLTCALCSTTFAGNITMQKASGNITMQKASGNITMQKASGNITMQRASGNTQLRNFRALSMLDYFYLILTSVMM